MTPPIGSSSTLPRRVACCRIVNAGSVVWGICSGFYCTNAAVDFDPSMALLGSGVILALSWLVCQIILFFRPVPASIVRRLLSAACFPLTFGVAIFFATTDVGLRGRLWLCESQLARFAIAVEPGTKWDHEKSAQVGLFTVREVDRHGDCVRMITAKDFLDDAGLAYCPVGQPARIGEDSYRHLWGAWWHWHRSW